MATSKSTRGGSSYGDWRACKARLRNAGVGPLGRFLSCLAEKLDAVIRTRDFRVHRSHGGLLGRVGIRHAPVAVAIPALLAVFLVFGPRPPLSLSASQEGFMAVLLLLAAWVALFGGMMLVRERWGFWLQMGWAAGVSLLLFAGLDASYKQAEQVLYRHLLLVLIPAVLVPTTIGGKLLARRLIQTVPDEHRAAFRERLWKTELFVSPPEIRLTGWGALRSILVALLYRLLMVLYLPAVCLMAVFPAGWTGEVLWVASAFVAVISLAAVSLTALHPRLDAMSVLVRRALFTGGQLVVSLLVIVLGLGRLAGIQYVSAIVESSYGPALSLMLLSAYAFFWFYEYWINRVLCEELLEMLAPRGDKGRRSGRLGRIKYAIPEKAVRTSVRSTRRVLQIHGGARFVTIGEGSGRRAGRENFQLYEKAELFERLAPPIDPPRWVGDRKLGDEEHAAAREKARECADAWPDLQNRIRFHFALVNVALVGALATAGIWVFAGPQRPEHAVVESGAETGGQAVAAAAEDAAGTGQGGGAGSGGSGWRADLRRLVFDGGPGRHAILLAGSGGGTRAAMYTIGVLGGLAELGALDRLALVSGVSGGGAALAYYVGRREALEGGDPAAWREFRCTLDDPFIQDVLDGAGEWRIFSEDRLGNLLGESFERRFRGAEPRFGTLGEVGPEIALVLNTSIAGRQGPLDCDSGERFRDCVHRLRRLTRGTETGGRLIFTNLLRTDAFPGLDRLHPRDYRFDYKVVADPTVRLTSAAALNANFPPVFPNAAVDIEPETMRYWVTDGGAVENRGVLSLLFALRQAAQEHRALGLPAGKLPKIHVLVAEASAAGTGYSKLPGVGSAFGASGKIASQLMKELVEEVQDELEAIGGPAARELVRLYYLDMPGPLRVDGGLGTHWMLAGNLRLGEPGECDPDRRGATGNRIWVSGRAVRNVTYGLFLEDPSALWGLECQGDGDPDAAGQAAAIQDILDASLARSGCWSQSYRDDWERLRRELEVAPPGGEGTAWVATGAADGVAAAEAERPGGFFEDPRNPTVEGYPGQADEDLGVSR